MYILKIWITLLVAVALCPLAQKYSCSLANDNHSTLNPSLESSYLFVDEDVPSVIPLGAMDPDGAETRSEMATKSQKTTDVKPMERKKPLRLNDSVKVKNETKFAKLKDLKLDEKTSKMLDVNKTGVDEASLTVKGNPGSLLNTAISRAINEADGSEARASNVSALEPTNSLYANHTDDLSDVNMDEEDTSMEGGEYIASHNETQKIIQPMALPTTSMCVDGNTTYALGDTIVRGCDEQCICGENATIENCKPLCSSPYVIAGRNRHDPFCGEQRVAENHCCAIVYCSESTSGVKADEESCTFGNKTVSPGEQIYDGCVRTCVCQTGGILKCQPRCPPNDTNSTVNHLDRCVALTDPRDSCCTITYCDVTLGEHEMKPDDPEDLSVNIIDVKVLNATAIKLKLSADLHNETIVQVSKNNDDDWTQDNPDTGGIISKLEPAHNYFVRVKEGNRTGPALRVIMPAEVVKTNVTEKIMCNHQGKQYKVGEKWYDECIALCICHENGKPECLTLECPTDFGLDVLNPHCLDWETVPPNFVAKAPNCCPEQVRCRNNGSCVYENNVYENWSEIPSNVTGCEKRCYCEIGKVSCQAACPPVPALPPSTLSCPANQAVLQHLPNDDCCSHWVCNTSGNTTSAYVGPLASNVNSWREIDDSENPNKSALPVNKSDATTSENTVSNPSAASPMFHYPMDPGYPTLPYNGPFNPNYRPTSASVEKVFQLPDKTKDKSKSKADAKKPTESVKIHHKEVDPPIMYQQQEHREPASQPDKFPLIPNQISGNVNENLQSNRPFIGPNKPLLFPFTPGNAQGIPTGLDADHFDANVGPPYREVRPGVQQVKKKISDNAKTPDTRKKPGQKTKEILPEELVHLINLHPALTQLNRPPSSAHPGLDEFHRQITHQREPSGNQIPLGYYNGIAVNGFKDPNVHVHNKDEGETIYHIHASEIPSTPQQIEKLLAHISQHDPNLGPFRYPSLSPSMIHNYPNGRPPPSHVDALNGVPHLNNPFTVQAPNQSDMQEHNFHTGFPMLAGIPGYNSQTAGQTSTNEIVIKALDALDDQTVRLIFTVPPVFVGLHGRVELRYTSDKNNMDPSTWKSQLFIPPDDLIATPQLEFELDGLEPATEYKVRVTMNLRDIGNSPSSKIYKVTTLSRQEEQGVLPPQIPIDAELRVAEANSTWANIVWKKFTEYEMQFIDGVQLRYKEHDGKVYSTTPLIHRAVTNYVIENLKPACTYEVGISIIPFPGQTTELISEKMAQLMTAMESDPYGFDVKVDIKMVKSQDVEITWTGVPYPEDKYVNIYRAIYQSDSGKGDTSTFKTAKRDSPAKTLISGLKPGTRYRLWLEMYLTNGKIKKSNVQDFITKPGVVLTSAGITQQGKLASLPLHEDDYYGPLVIVAIVASLAILSTLILLMMLMKRRSSSKADISPRKTTSAYDNPSYKTCEDLVTITNGGSKVTQDHELLDVNPCEQKEPV